MRASSDDHAPDPEDRRPDPRPAGFGRCAACAYRRLAAPRTCLACLQRSLPGALPGGGGGQPLPGCAACGQLLEPGAACTNRWCRRADRGWSVIFAVGVHDGPLRRGIVAYKYRDQRWWADVLGRLVAGWLLTHQPWVEDFDLLVPVPSYLGPGGRRRWDPVGELAAVAAGLVGPLWELAPGAVVKTAETPAMTGRSAAARSSLAEGPLRSVLAVPDRACVDGARVLVLDDVVTDGATLREVARVLRRAGAAEVAGLALTRPAWSPPPRRPTVAR